MQTLSFESVREQFPRLGKEIWLQNAGVAPTPECVRTAVEAAARSMHEDGPRVWQINYMKDCQELRRRIGDMISGKPECVTITRGTAHGLSLLMALDWKPGDNIVSARLEYPANLLPWIVLEKRGVELRLVEPIQGRVTPEAVFEQMDENTRAVSLSFVQFWNGYRIDTARIGAECRRRGVIHSVDGIQGVGVIPLDVGEAFVDLLAVGSYKWMLGPGGTGFCYLDSALLERLDPPMVGVGTMSGLTESTVSREYYTDFQKFEESGLCWFDVAGMLAGVKLLQDTGVEQICRRLIEVTQTFGRELESMGCEIIEPWPRLDDEASGIISFRRPDVTNADVLKQLEANGIRAKERVGFVRFSPHFYISDDEIERVLQAVRDIS